MFTEVTRVCCCRSVSKVKDNMAGPETRILVLLHSIAKEQNLEKYDIKLEPISSGGANYMSILYVATIKSKNRDDLHLFIKVAAMGEKMRTDNALKVYEIENFIYTDLQTKFRKLEDKNGIAEKDRLKMCKYYGASTVVMEEMIVLENLSMRGFICHDRLKSVDWEYAAAATASIAKLHALSMALEHEDPAEFAKTKKFFEFDGNLDPNTAGLEVFWNGSKEAAFKAVREENLEKLKKFFDDMDLFAFFKSSAASKREVLVHGDFRPSNLMHYKRDDGSVEVIIVDYQTMRGASPIGDLFYFIFTGTDAEFREKYYQKLLDHYYTELSAAMTRLGLKPDEHYSRKDYDMEIQEKLPFGLAVAVFTLPVVTVDTENAPKVSDEMELSDFSIQKTGSLYPERLNGVVDDFVRWGVL